MLAKAEVQRLVKESKISSTLGIENLLPVNNNKCILDIQGITSVTVVEDDPAVGAKPIAFGVLNRCTSNNYYCSILVASPNYKNNFVQMESVKAKNSFFGVSDENQNHFLFKITNILTELPNLSGLPQYYSAFANPIAKPLLQSVIDELIEKTCGHLNFELVRNITVDLYDISEGVTNDDDKFWRDYAGFIVTDRSRYAHIEITRERFLEVLKNINDETSIHNITSEHKQFRIEKLTKQNIDNCIDYDSNVALAINRQDYLEYLFELYGLIGMVAYNDENETVGYIISIGSTILQCYAEETNIAKQLFEQHITLNIEQNENVISFFTELGKTEWIDNELIKNATRSRRVRRFHTRALTTNVKWSKIFAMNIGVFLF